MSVQQELPFGMLYIDKRTIIELTEIAVCEVEGVGKTIARLTHPFKGKGSKGISVEIHEEGLTICVHVALYRTAVILPTCLALQRKIKEDIERITGLSVTFVSVKVEQLIKAYLI